MEVSILLLSVDINIPSIYKELLEWKGRISVEHCDVDCRMAETVLGLALNDVASFHNVVVLCEDYKKLKYLLLKWLVSTKHKKWTVDPDVVCYRIFGCDLWIISHASARITLPVQIHRVYGIDCHRSKDDISTVYNCSVFLTGVYSNKNHWFYQFSRKEEVKTYRFPLGIVKSEFPRVTPLAEDNPNYRRLMLLEDVDPEVNQGFIRFAHSRLKIRTDKPIEFLSERQQYEASLQYGTPVVSFDVSRLQRRYLAQKRLARVRGKRPWFILLKYRRGGFTTIEQGQSYQMVVSQPQSYAVTLAHTDRSTRRIFRISSLYQQRDTQSPRLVNDSKTELEFENGSLFFIGTAGSRGFTRGDTLQRVHGSEVAKWCEGPRQMELVEDLTAGLLGAASHGEVVLESTPDGREWFCQTYEDSKKGLNEFTSIFLRWFDDPLNRCKESEYDKEEIADTLHDKEKYLIEQHGLDYAQIAFRRQAKKIYGRLFPQEMPEDDTSCFLSSGVCFFDTEILLELLEKLTVETTNGNKKHHPGGVEIRWEEPIPGEKYVAGVDTSEGLPGCDLSGIGILKKRTGEQVATLHGLFTPRALGHHVVRLCNVYNKALVGIERQNHGHAVLQKVIELGYSKPHFRGGPLYYFHQSNNIKSARPGWSTDSESRPIMLDDLADAIESGAMKIRDKEFVAECLSFRLQSNGKFEADPAAHDDTVMKWGIAWQMRQIRTPTPKISVLGELRESSLES